MISDKELRQLMAINKRGEAYCPKGDELLLSALEELLQRRQGEQRQKSTQRTHWEGCWREHHECAVALLERLMADGNCMFWEVGREGCCASEEPWEIADQYADEHLDNDGQGVIEVQVATRLPDRKMRVWLTGGEERELNWEWVK